MRPAPATARTVRALLLALAPLALSAQHAPAPSPPGPASPAPVPRSPDVAQPSPPALVVLVTVDQMRADYLDRFRGNLTGGFARLLRGGAVFSDAHHDHAITETAPGHATLGSGRFPRSTGIFLNRVGVEDPKYPLIAGGIGDGAAPTRFHGTSLADWLRDRNKDARIVSISMKDRGAILPVGRVKGDVYWYSPNGFFTTSSYYAKSLPDWVKRFNALGLPMQYAGQSWDLALAPGEYKERDSVNIEGAGRNIAFPHRLPADGLGAASQIRATPYIDEITLAFALHALRSRELGADRSATPRTDLLAISLSATDVIGHRHGPDSREAHDNIVRLDRALGHFLDSLYATRDSARIVVALSSDHGVSTIPELAWSMVPQPVPLPERVTLYELLTPLRARMRAEKVDTNAIDIDGEILLMNRTAFAGKTLAPDTVVALFASLASKVAGVLRVDRLRDVYADSAKDIVSRRWSHQFPRDVNIEAVVTLTRYSTFGGNIAAHGTPYEYDSHVPLILYGAGVKPGRYTSFVRTVDLAPTLAALAGAKPSERIDGVVLRDAIR